VDQLIEELSERGWLLNNLFQLDSGLWQCNLRTATHHTAYGKGESAIVALELAIDNIERAIESDPVQPTVSFSREEWRELNQTQPASIASILANLRQPSPPVFARRL
jgi:hypothetical protein